MTFVHVLRPPALSSIIFIIVLLDIAVVSKATVVIACTNNKTSTISSNEIYTLTNCTNNNSSPFFELTAAAAAAQNNSTTLLENVTIHVEGGTVLPRLTTMVGSSTTTTAFRNIHVFVTSVMAIFPLLELDSNEAISMLPLTAAASVVLSNISVTLQNASIVLNVTASTVAASVAPLLFASSTGNINITSVRIAINNSNISVNVSITGTVARLNVVAIFSLGLTTNGTLSGIMVIVEFSSIKLFMASVEPTGYQNVYPVLFRFDAVASELQNFPTTTSLTGVLFVSTSSDFWMHATIPAISNETVAVMSIKHFFIISDVVVQLTNVVARVDCICGGISCSWGNASAVSARVVVIQGRLDRLGVKRLGSVANQSLVAQRCTFVVNTPKLALGFVWQYALILYNVSIMVTDCSYHATSTPLDIGTAARSQSLLEISSNDNATEINATIEHCQVEFDIESGGCQNAISSVVGFLDNISYSTVRVTNVTVVASIANGTSTVFPIPITPSGNMPAAVLTMLTTIVNVAMQISTIMNAGEDIIISITKTTIHAVHSTSVNASAKPNATILVSALSAVNIIRSVDKCDIHVEATHVRRSFLLPPPTSATVNSVQFNVTSVISMFDYATTVADSASSALKAAVTQLMGSTPKMMHVNTTVTIVGNCTVTYFLQPSVAVASLGPSDYIALIILPTVSSECTYTVKDSQFVAQTFSMAANFASVIGGASAIASVGSARLINSIVNVTNVSGLSLLVFVAIAPLVLEGISTALWFTSINLRALLNPQSTQRYAIGSTTTTNIISIDVTLLPTKLTPFLHIALCTFENFTFLLMPSVINMSSSFALPRARVLSLGCNLWDGRGMPSNVIMNKTDEPLLLSHVAYPRSSFNDSILCHGFLETATAESFSETNSRTALITAITYSHTALITVNTFSPSSNVQSRTALISARTFSSSLSYEPPAEVPASPAVPPEAISTVTAVVGVVGAAAGAFSAIIDAQSLVALGSSVCAPQALHEATSASQFLLSPFYSLGDYAMVFGNLGLFLLFHAVHRILRRRAPSPVYTQRKQVSVIQHNPDVPIQFPNHSISMAMLLAPGVVNGGVRGIFSGEVVDTIGGVVGLVAMSLGVWWRWRGGNLREVKLMRFVPWPHRVRRSFIAPWLLPYGQWGPLSLRSMHGRLRGAVRVGCEWLSAQTITVALLVQAVASIPVPTSWCVGLWFVLCGIQLISVVLTVVVRPARAPVTDVLQIAGLITVAALEVIASICSTQTIEATDAEAPLSILSLLSMAVSFAKAFQSAVAFLWERNQNKLLTGGDDVDAGNSDEHRSTLLQSPDPSDVRIYEALRELISAICFFTEATGK